MNIIEIRVQAVSDVAAGLAAARAEAQDAAEAIAADLEDAGVQGGAGFGDALRGGIKATTAGLGEQISAQLGDGLDAAAGDAGITAGQEIGRGVVAGVSADLPKQMASVGQEGADALAGGLESGASGVAMLGSEISDLLRAGIASGLPLIDADVQTLMRQLPSVVDPDATYAGLQIGDALAAGLGRMGAAAAAAIAGVLTVVGVGLEAGLGDRLAQAGQSAGPSLVHGISDGAAGSAGRAADAVGRAIEARLTDKLTESGAPVGDALLAGIQDGVKSAADSTAVKISESLQPPLEEQMTLLGQGAGDAFNAGLEHATGGSGGGAGASGGGGMIVQEFAQAEAEVEQEAQSLGEKAAGSFATGWQTRQGLIPFGGKLEPDELMNMGQQSDPFVPDMTSSQNAWILASKTGAKQAAEAAWQAYGDELSGLVIPPDRFALMTDAGIAQWRENVAVQAAASGDGFVSAFADAMTMGMAGIDYAALSDAQAAALGEAMRGTITQGVAQAEPQAQAAAAAVGQVMVEQVAESMAELPAVAAEQGGAAGSVFARAFNGAKGAIAESFQAEFVDDPAWATAMDKARTLGADVQDSFSAVAQNIRTEFAQDPAWQARMADVRALSDATVGGIKDAYGAISGLGSAAVGHVKDGFSAIGDFGAAMVAREKEAISEFGDFSSTMVERARIAFESLAAYAAENGDTIGGKFAGAITSSVSAFTGSVSAIGESVRLLFAQAPEQAALAGAATGSAFDLALAEGLAQSAPDAVAAVQGLEAQIGAALGAGEDALAQSLISRLDAIQLAAQGLDIAGPVQAQASALTVAGDEIGSVFESIYQRGALLSDNLATAMANSLVGIEADTSSFTAAELAQWDAFFTTLNERGTEAAYQMAVTMGSLRGKDLVGSGLTSVGNPMGAGAGAAAQEAEGVASSLGSVEKAAAGATSGMGGMASMMYGPWGMAIYGAMAVLPMLGGAFTSLAAAIEPTQAVLLNTANLATAISNDGNVAGAATAAFVAQSSATDGMAKSAAQAGVSLAVWTEAAMGNRAAQTAVTDAVGKLNQQQLNAAVATQENASQTGKFSGELQDAHATVTAQSDATNRLTDANQKLVNSMSAEAQQVASAIKTQTDLSQATMTLDMNSQIFSATLTGLYTKMQLSAQQTAIASVANLDLGVNQTALNQQLVLGEQAYTQSTTQASAYGTALTMLNGDVTTLLGAEASFTTALGALTTSMKTNGESLDVNTVKGAANVQAVLAIAHAADQAAIAVYQNEVNTKGSTQAYEDANAKLEQEKTAFENQAIAAHMSKDKVKELADQLFQLPPSVDIPINANTTPAQNAVNSLLNSIDYSTAYVNVGTKLNSPNLRAAGGPAPHYAAAGSVQGGSTMMNEAGPELVNLPNGSMVVPAANTAALMSGAFAPTAGASSMVLEVVGGEPELVAWIRKIVRVRGGGGPDSVQRAFGQVASR